MTLTSQREVNNTREKLHRLEQMFAESIADTEGDPEVRDAELESLQRQINQFKEEVARFEARLPARR